MTLFPTALRALGAAASATLAALLVAGSLATPAAADDDCAAEITKLKPVAERQSDADTRAEAEKLLQQAHEELVTEGDAEECMDKVADVKDVLGVKG